HKAVRIYNNVFDNSGIRNYGLELSVNDAEVDHNYFYGGIWGITDWRHDIYGNNKPYENWKIHHNVFYDIKGGMPGMVRTETNGIINLEFYNNTVELVGTAGAAIVQFIGGQSRNVKVKNNLIINKTTGPYNGNNPKFIDVGSKASVSGLEVTNNFLQNLPVGNYSGSYSNNYSGDPQITASGSRPDPYYKPKSGSPLIDKGVNVGFPYSGSAPDIGAFEYGGTSATPPANKSPQGSVAAPSNNSTFAHGATIRLQANAADTDGTVTKVEFFSGTNKLGEDSSSPYTYDWNDAPAGTHKITIKVTDNDGATFTSPAVTITVVANSNQDPAVSIASPATNSEFKAGETITIRANATDSDGNIEKVEFY